LTLVSAAFSNAVCGAGVFYLLYLQENWTKLMNILKREQTIVFQKWFNKLPVNIHDKIVEYIDRVLEGNTSNCKVLRQGVSEISRRA